MFNFAEMKLAYMLLTFVGLMPRRLLSTKKSTLDSPIFGPVSFLQLVICIVWMVLRFSVLIIFLARNENFVYASGSFFDVFGSVMWDVTWMLCEIASSALFLINSGKLAESYNKMVYLKDIFGISKLSTDFIRNHSRSVFPLFVFYVMCISMICFTQPNFSTLQIVLTCITSTYSYLTVYFYKSVFYNLAFIQRRLHLMDQLTLKKLGSISLENDRHPLNILIYNWNRKSVTNFQLPAAIEEIRDPMYMYVLHQKIQGTLNSLIDSFMEALGSSMLFPIFSNMVGLTFTVYFLIGRFLIGGFEIFNMLLYMLLALYSISILINLASPLNDEVRI